MINSKRAFVTLDGLRGIAALAVLTRHTPYFRSPFFESYLAVDFFFVLSGFVLAHAYGKRLRSNLSIIDFIKIRLFRLYPLYGLAIVISGLLILLSVLRGKYMLTVQDAINFSTAMFFLPSPAGAASADLFPLNGPAWSLFFELVANLGWALVWRRLGDLALAILVAASAFILIGSVLSGSLGFGFAPNTGIMDNGYQWGSIAAGFVRVSYSFFCGVFIFRIWSQRKWLTIVPPWLVAGALFVALAVQPPLNYQAAYDLIVTILILPLIVWFGASSPVKGLAARSFALLGAASFGIYVLQVPLHKLTARALMHVGAELGPEPLLGLGFVVSVLLLDRYFDRPIRNWLMASVHQPTIVASLTP